MLIELDYLPKALLEMPASQLHKIIPQPTLIHLQGRHQAPLFVSVLMHGNETTGFLAMQQLLKRYRPGGGTHELPRSLSLFIANVSAAKQGKRHLEAQPDYNRIWSAEEHPDTPEYQMTQKIIKIMSERQVFASVDIHNNTGLNPHYACINVLHHDFFHLATLFSRTVVYFIRPASVQSMAFSCLCPAVTLECGQAGEPHGTEHAIEYIDACLHLSHFPEHPVAEQDMELFHTVATVRVPEHIDFAFGEQTTPLQFSQDMDHMNFRELSAGTVFGQLAPFAALSQIPLQVINEAGQDATAQYFMLKHNAIQLRCPVMPAMLTTDTDIIRQDCLCYLMERKAYHQPLAGH
ncbi:M14 family metallopeptidase [Candidatus Venteria ishoeyi]|uniref:Succinylglutamate desuccinylase n=1 Tax=Candidatus Venteria ishoeyi TaxID=1899563 RepID=A0A1H6FH94_9GAMM|nr:M14 family metallopeptidase [Candidatus Venteria ishoeyi]MDM8546815.1 M14 family metallopeptidase [Candidatus Venteria ishoeyi]SEH08405.1 Succinylglutamate desuccinylase [Candidatus Venteria ishoeyi]